MSYSNEIILRASYELYQEMLKAMSNRDFKALEACISKASFSMDINLYED